MHRSDENSGAERPISITTILLLARRRIGTIVVTTVVAVLLAALFLQQQRPTFQSWATIQLDAPSMGGAFGDLGRLVNLGASPAVEGELAAVRARYLAEATVAPIEGVAVATPEAVGYDRALGLTTRVEDGELDLFTLLRRRFADPPLDGRPAIIPAARLFAAITVEEESAPREIDVRFLREDRIELTTPAPLAVLGLGERYREERAFTPGTPIAYRGLSIGLVTEGDVVGRDYRLVHQREFEAVERLMGATAAEESSRGSGVLRVSITDTDPRRARESLVALCTHYLEAANRRSKQNPDLSVEYITGILDEQQRLFEAAQAQIGRIQARTPEVLVTTEVAGQLVAEIARQEVRRVRTEMGRRALADVTTRLAAGDLTALALLDEASTTGIVGSLGLSVDPLTTAYVRQLAELTAEATSLEQLYVATHPSLVQLRGRIDQLTAAIRGQLEARAANLASELEDTKRQQAELRRSLLELPTNVASLARPLLVVETYRELVPFLTQSLHAAQISSSAADITYGFIDRPSLPTAIQTPNAARTLLVALALGLFAGVLLGLWREPRAGRIRGWRDVEEELELVVLGTVVRHATPTPTASERGTAPTAALSPPDSPAAPAWRHLRAQLEASTPPLRTFAAISPRRGAGASTVARNLAIACARHGERTLLVDLDLHQGEVARAFATPPAPGVAELLTGDATWEECTRETDLDTLHVLPAGAAAVHAGDALGRAAVARLVEESAERFDRILFDLPPALASAEVASLAGLFDGVALVVRAGRARRGEVHAAEQLLQRAGASARGVIVTATSRGAGTHPSQGGRA